MADHPVSWYENRYIDKKHETEAKYEELVRDAVVGDYVNQFGSTPEADGLKVTTFRPNWGDARIEVWFNPGDREWSGAEGVEIQFIFPTFDYLTDTDERTVYWRKAVKKAKAKIAAGGSSLTRSDLTAAAEYMVGRDWYPGDVGTLFDGWDPEEDYNPNCWSQVARLRESVK